MRSYPEIYQDYVGYHNMIASASNDPTPPLTFERWMTFDPFHNEEAKFKADEFVASLHPDGGAMAGFKGVQSAEVEEAA